MTGTEIFAYILIGFGIGYMVTLGATGGPSTALDRRKEDLEFAKLKIKMFSKNNKNLRSH